MSSFNYAKGHKSRPPKSRPHSNQKGEWQSITKGIFGSIADETSFPVKVLENRHPEAPKQRSLGAYNYDHTSPASSCAGPAPPSSCYQGVCCVNPYQYCCYSGAPSLSCCYYAVSPSYLCPTTTLVTQPLQEQRSQDVEVIREGTLSKTYGGTPSEFARESYPVLNEELASDRLSTSSAESIKLGVGRKSNDAEGDPAPSIALPSRDNNDLFINVGTRLIAAEPEQDDHNIDFAQVPAAQPRATRGCRKRKCIVPEPCQQQCCHCPCQPCYDINTGRKRARGDLDQDMRRNVKSFPSQMTKRAGAAVSGPQHTLLRHIEIPSGASALRGKLFEIGPRPPEDTITYNANSHQVSARYPISNVKPVMKTITPPGFQRFQKPPQEIYNKRHQKSQAPLQIFTQIPQTPSIRNTRMEEPRLIPHVPILTSKLAQENMTRSRGPLAETHRPTQKQQGYDTVSRASPATSPIFPEEPLLPMSQGMIVRELEDSQTSVAEIRPYQKKQIYEAYARPSRVNAARMHEPSLPSGPTMAAGYPETTTNDISPLLRKIGAETRPEPTLLRHIGIPQGGNIRSGKANQSHIPQQTIIRTEPRNQELSSQRHENTEPRPNPQQNNRQRGPSPQELFDSPSSAEARLPTQQTVRHGGTPDQTFVRNHTKATSTSGSLQTFGGHHVHPAIPTSTQMPYAPRATTLLPRETHEHVEVHQAHSGRPAEAQSPSCVHHPQTLRRHPGDPQEMHTRHCTILTAQQPSPPPAAAAAAPFTCNRMISAPCFVGDTDKQQQVWLEIPTGDEEGSARLCCDSKTSTPPAAQLPESFAIGISNSPEADGKRSMGITCLLPTTSSPHEALQEDAAVLYLSKCGNSDQQVNKPSLANEDRYTLVQSYPLLQKPRSCTGTTQPSSLSRMTRSSNSKLPENNTEPYPVSQLRNLQCSDTRETGGRQQQLLAGMPSTSKWQTPLSFSQTPSQGFLQCAIRKPECTKSRMEGFRTDPSVPLKAICCSRTETICRIPSNDEIPPNAGNTATHLSNLFKIPAMPPSPRHSLPEPPRFSFFELPRQRLSSFAFPSLPRLPSPLDLPLTPKASIGTLPRMPSLPLPPKLSVPGPRMYSFEMPPAPMLSAVAVPELWPPRFDSIHIPPLRRMSSFQPSTPPRLPSFTMPRPRRMSIPPPHLPPPARFSIYEPPKTVLPDSATYPPLPAPILHHLETDFDLQPPDFTLVTEAVATLADIKLPDFGELESPPTSTPLPSVLKIQDLDRSPPDSPLEDLYSAAGGSKNHKPGKGQRCKSKGGKGPAGGNGQAAGRGQPETGKNQCPPAPFYPLMDPCHPCKHPAKICINGMGPDPQALLPPPPLFDPWQQAPPKPCCNESNHSNNNIEATLNAFSNFLCASGLINYSTSTTTGQNAFYSSTASGPSSDCYFPMPQPPAPCYQNNTHATSTCPPCPCSSTGPSPSANPYPVMPCPNNKCQLRRFKKLPCCNHRPGPQLTFPGQHRLTTSKGRGGSWGSDDSLYKEACSNNSSQYFILKNNTILCDTLENRCCAAPPTQTLKRKKKQKFVVLEAENEEEPYCISANNGHNNNSQARRNNRKTKKSCYYYCTE